MTVDSLKGLRFAMEKKLPKKRFSHVLSVEKEIVWLASQLLPYEILRLRTAALLHDNTKNIKDEGQASLCDSLGIPLTEQQRNCPPILHALTGALTASRDFPDETDADIIRAIRYHTTGSPEMTFFDRLLFMADFTEAERKWEKCLLIRTEMHTMPEQASLCQKREYFNSVFWHCLQLKNDYLNETGLPQDPMGLLTLKAFQKRFCRI